MIAGPTTPNMMCPRCGTLRSPAEVGTFCARCLAQALLAPVSDFEPRRDLEGEAGRTLGSYELLEEVGRGGMGVVFRARHVGLDREVALKVMRDSLLRSSADVERFRDEAATAARLRHPHIVTLFEIGDADGHPYFAMEFIAGRHLGELTRNGPLPSRQAAELLWQISEALQHAHEQGVLHRDLKPSNILVDPAGLPHVTDFGLAKRFDAELRGGLSRDLTLTGQVLGTPAYMAPEQAVAKRGEADPRVDVYSLGALLYHVVTGRAPFTGEGLAEVLRQVADQEPLSPRLINPAVPADLATICLKCLSKDPARRFASANELAADLRRFLAGESIHARPAGAAERVWRWCRRKPALAGSLGLALVALTVGFATTTWQWRRAEASSKEKQKEVWKSRRLEAKALRAAGEMGQRSRILSVIQEEGRSQATPDLRTEAISALALMDFRELPIWKPPQPELADVLMPPKYAVAPDDGRVAMWWRLAPSEHVLKVFASDPGAPPMILDNDGRMGDELSFSPDGRWLAAAYFRGPEVLLWDTRQKSIRFRFEVKRGTDFSIDFSVDGRRLAICSASSTVRMYNLETGAEMEPITSAAGGHVVRARFNPRHPWIAVAAENALIIRDFENKTVVHREVFEAGLSPALAWHPDGERVAAMCWMQPEIYLCNVMPDGGSPTAAPRDSRRRRILRAPGSPAFLLTFSPDGATLVARGRDGITRVWDVAAERVLLSSAIGLASGFSSDGSRLYFDRETAGVGAWEIITNRPLYRTLRAPGPASFLGASDFSVDGGQLVWGQNGTTPWADLEHSSIRLLGTEGSAAARFDRRDGSIITAGEEGLVRWRDSTREQLIPAGQCQAFAQSSDGRLLAALAETNLWLLDTRNRRLPVPGNLEGDSVALSSDGRWAAVGTFGQEAFLIDTASGATSHSLPGYRAAAVFDPQSRWLATGTAQDYRLWSVGDWRLLRKWPRESAAAQYSPIAVSPDGTLLAVTLRPRVISLLSPATGEENTRLEAPAPLFISALAFSRDGRQLAASSENGVMQIWNLAEARRGLRNLGLDWDSAIAH